MKMKRSQVRVQCEAYTYLWPRITKSEGEHVQVKSLRMRTSPVLMLHVVF